MTDPSSYDLIIVGAGSSGCALAARLSEDPDRRVLVIEAGRDYNRPEQIPAEVAQASSTLAWMPGYLNSWNFVGALSPERPQWPMARGKIVGGSSAINATVFRRPSQSNFDNWAARGSDLWSYEQVLPFYVKSEHDLNFAGDYHGRSGPITVDRPLVDEARDISEAFVGACVSAGFPLKDDKNAPGGDGVGPTPRNVAGSTRVNAAMAYLTAAVRARPNLTLIGDVFVRRVVFDGNRTIGVECARDGEPLSFMADQVVLSAGAINTPHLLILSGIGPAAALRAHGIPVVHESPGVGTEVKDHPTIFLAAHVDDGPALPRDTVVSHNALDFSVLGREAEIAWGKMAETLHLDAALGIEQSGGEISLASGDPTVAPRINLNYLSEPSDLAALTMIVRTALDLLGCPEFRSMNSDPHDLPSSDASDRELGAWIRQNIASSAHTHNSTPMGPSSDPFAVVDERCHVHGVDGLRVADAGIIPAIGIGPAATAVMIGERVAALVSEEDSIPASLVRG